MPIELEGTQASGAKVGVAVGVALAAGVGVGLKVGARVGATNIACGLSGSQAAIPASPTTSRARTIHRSREPVVLGLEFFIVLSRHPLLTLGQLSPIQWAGIITKPGKFRFLIFFLQAFRGLRFLPAESKFNRQNPILWHCPPQLAAKRLLLLRQPLARPATTALQGLAIWMESGRWQRR